MVHACIPEGVFIFTMEIVFVKKEAKHPNGMTVVFNEEDHVYRIKETGQILTSVTTFIDRFFPHFDADKMAPRCVNKPKYKGMTAEQIKESWEANAQRARNEGTNVHEYAENLWAGKDKPLPISDRCHLLFEQVDRASKKLKERGLVFSDAEKIVFSPELGLAGMIDLLLYDPLMNQFVIIDWKQNGTISTSNRWDTARKPISHLEATDLVKYSLQLNLYRFIFKYEGYYPLSKDIRMALLHLTENSNCPYKINLMLPEIFQLIGAVRQQQESAHEGN